MLHYSEPYVYCEIIVQSKNSVCAKNRLFWHLWMAGFEITFLVIPCVTSWIIILLKASGVKNYVDNK